MKFYQSLIGIVLLLALSGCSFPTVPEQPVEVNFQTALPYVPTAIPISATLLPTESDIVLEATKEIPAPTTYMFQVTLDAEQYTLNVVEEIDYINKNKTELSDITLMVPMNHETGIFELQQLMIPGAVSQPAYEVNGVKLKLSLTQPLKTDERLLIRMEYRLNLPNERGVLGYTDRQINVCDWYIFIPPYREDTGWMANEYHSVGEYLVYDVADFDATINLIHASEDLNIIGSVPGTRDDNSWHFAAQQVRTLVWTASSEYEKLVQAENPNVVAYVFPEDVNAGWSALATTISAWNLYTAIYGEPRQEQLILIEADFYDGMEYDGLFYLGFDYFESYGGGEKNYLTAIAAHETAHQWWFAAVGNDAANEPWLDESLAIYSELLFYNTYYPGNEDWWWKFRVDSFLPSGAVNDTVYPYSSWRPYINAIYLRGAMMISEIRNSMGDEAFFRFLQAYYQSGSGKIMTRHDFFMLASQYSDTDFSGIYREYFLPE